MPRGRTSAAMLLRPRAWPRPRVRVCQGDANGRLRRARGAARLERYRAPSCSARAGREVAGLVGRPAGIAAERSRAAPHPTHPHAPHCTVPQLVTPATAKLRMLRAPYAAAVCASGRRARATIVAVGHGALAVAPSMAPSATPSSRRSRPWCQLVGGIRFSLAFVPALRSACVHGCRLLFFTLAKKFLPTLLKNSQVGSKKNQIIWHYYT